MHVALSNCLQVLLSPLETAVFAGILCGKSSIDTINLRVNGHVI